MSRKLAYRTLTPVNIFRYGLTALVALTVIQLPIRHGHAFFSLLHPDVNDTFMDFFNSIYDAIVENPYTERGIIYPPLTQLFYRLCGTVLPEGMAARDWRSSEMGLILISVVTALSFILIYRTLLPEDRKNDSALKRLILWIMFGTVPFWYAFERANLILITLGLLAYFVKNYQSDRPLRRELALISLAIASSFKIYPACFGLLLLTSKQYKSALRCVIYGVVLFFVPFVFFGGVESATAMISNILKTNTIMASQGWGFKLNIDNTLSFVTEALHIPLTGAAIIKILYAAIIFFIFIFSKEEWQRLLSLSLITIIFPSFSYTYTMILVAIPLVAFLSSFPKATTRNLLYSLLFLCMFAPFPFDGKELFDAAADYLYPLNLTTAISSLAILGILPIIVIDIIYSHVQAKKHQNTEIALVLHGKLTTAEARFLLIGATLSIVLVAIYFYCDHLYVISVQ